MILYKDGFAISNFLYIPLIEIHNKQIINAKHITGDELSKTDKSVIGQALVGGLILGPLGAIIGGMSGVNGEKIKNINYLIFNYWDIPSRKPQPLLLRGNKTNIVGFARRLNGEMEKSANNPIIQKTPNKGGCMGVLMFILISLTFLFFIYLWCYIKTHKNAFYIDR